MPEPNDPVGGDDAPFARDDKKNPGRYPELKDEVNHAAIPVLNDPVSTGEFETNVPVLNEMVDTDEQPVESTG